MLKERKRACIKYTKFALGESAPHRERKMQTQNCWELRSFFHPPSFLLKMEEEEEE